MDRWDVIWNSIKGSGIQQAELDVLPAENRVLESILKGDLEVYFVLKSGTLIAILSLTETYEVISGTKSLIIYSLYGVQPLTAEDWILGLLELKKVAKAKACSLIIAQTANKKIIEVTKAMGGDTNWTLIKLEA